MSEFPFLCYFLLGVNFQSGALLVRTEEQVDEADYQQECYNSSDTKSAGGADIREGSAAYTGLITVIGVKVDIEQIKDIFGVK